MNNNQKIRIAVRQGRGIKIIYRKFDGDISRRIVTNINYNNEFEDDGFYNEHIKGYCHLRNEERTFKISRIVSIEILEE